MHDTGPNLTHTPLAWSNLIKAHPKVDLVHSNHCWELRRPKHGHLKIILDCGWFLHVKNLEGFKKPRKRSPSHGIDSDELDMIFGDSWRDLGLVFFSQKGWPNLLVEVWEEQLEDCLRTPLKTIGHERALKRNKPKEKGLESILLLKGMDLGM